MDISRLGNVSNSGFTTGAMISGISTRPWNTFVNIQGRVEDET